MDKASINTDRELFKETAKDWKDEGYMPKVFVTKEESIGMNVGGMVFVMPIREWHKMAEQNAMLKDLGRPSNRLERGVWPTRIRCLNMANNHYEQEVKPCYPTI